MSTQQSVNLQPPRVLRRFDGVPVDIEQFGDRVTMYRQEHHTPKSAGYTGRCTNARCTRPAVIDKRVWSGKMATWRAVCAPHARTYADLLGPTMRELVHELLDAAQAQQEQSN